MYKLSRIPFFAALALSILPGIIFLYFSIQGPGFDGLGGVAIIVSILFIISVLHFLLFNFFLTIYLLLQWIFRTEQFFQSKLMNSLLFHIVAITTWFFLFFNVRGFISLYESLTLLFAFMLISSPIFVIVSASPNTIQRLMEKYSTTKVILLSFFIVIFMLCSSLLLYYYIKNNYRYDVSKIDSIASDAKAATFISRQLKYGCELTSFYSVNISPEKVPDISTPETTNNFRYFIHSINRQPELFEMNPYNASRYHDTQNITNQVQILTQSSGENIVDSIRKISETYPDQYYLLEKNIGYVKDSFLGGNHQVNLYGVYNKPQNKFDLYLSIYSKSDKICSIYGRYGNFGEDYSIYGNYQITDVN